jgi:hypothetical protein
MLFEMSNVLTGQTLCLPTWRFDWVVLHALRHPIGLLHPFDTGHLVTTITVTADLYENPQVYTLTWTHVYLAITWRRAIQSIIPKYWIWSLFRARHEFGSLNCHWHGPWKALLSQMKLPLGNIKGPNAEQRESLWIARVSPRCQRFEHNSCSCIRLDAAWTILALF